MSNYSQQSKVLLVSAINQEKGTFISPNDVYFIGPTANDHPDYDTKVTMVALESSPYRDSKVIEYNKVDFAGIFTVPIIFTSLGNITTTTDLVKQLNAEYGTQLDETDIVVEAVTPKLLSSTVAMFTLRANENALIIKGSVDVYFSDTNAIRKWIRNVSTEYTSDGKTLKVSGSNRRVQGKVVLGDALNYSPSESSSALSLGADGKFNEVIALPTTNPVKLRFRNSSLLEVVGASEETSYDRNGSLLRISPQLPPIFETSGNLPAITAKFTDTTVDYVPSFTLNVKRSRSGTIYYVDSVNGNDLNGQGTEQSPYRTFNAALTRTPLARTIVVKEGSAFNYGEGVSAPITDRSLDIVSSGTGKITMSGAYKLTTWTKVNDNVYSAPLTTDVAGVVDYSGKGESGRGVKLTKVGALADMVEGSYFANGTLVYVQTTNGRIPDGDVKVISTTPVLSVKGNSQVYLENVIITDSVSGITAESTAVDKVPNLYVVNSTIQMSLGNGVSGYGANIFTENCVITGNLGNGTFYGLDRQSPGLGIKSRFSEYLNKYSWNGSTDPFAGATSMATAGTVGIRCKDEFLNSYGRPILDYGTNTATANYLLKINASTINDVLNGALITAGHPDSVNFGRSMVLVFSSTLNQKDGSFSMATQGNGNLYLYDTPVGKMGQYGLADPYKFIYTSSQRAQQ